MHMYEVSAGCVSLILSGPVWQLTYAPRVCLTAFTIRRVLFLRLKKDCTRLGGSTEGSRVLNSRVLCVTSIWPKFELFFSTTVWGYTVHRMYVWMLTPLIFSFTLSLFYMIRWWLMVGCILVSCAYMMSERLVVIILNIPNIHCIYHHSYHLWNWATSLNHKIVKSYHISLSLFLSLSHTQVPYTVADVWKWTVHTTARFQFQSFQISGLSGADVRRSRDPQLDRPCTSGRTASHQVLQCCSK